MSREIEVGFESGCSELNEIEMGVKRIWI